jgi:hypothetical protein
MLATKDANGCDADCKEGPSNKEGELDDGVDYDV